MSQLNGWRLSRSNVEKPEEAETLSALVQPVCEVTQTPFTDVPLWLLSP